MMGLSNIKVQLWDKRPIWTIKLSKWRKNTSKFTTFTMAVLNYKTKWWTRTRSTRRTNWSQTARHDRQGTRKKPIFEHVNRSVRLLTLSLKVEVTTKRTYSHSALIAYATRSCSRWTNSESMSNNQRRAEVCWLQSQTRSSARSA